MDSDRQLTLFTATDLKDLTKSGQRCDDMQMDGEYLQNWKAKIRKHQQSCRISPPPEQATLFDLESTGLKPSTINPFTLTLHSFSFFRLPASEPGNACIYFVIDTAAELVLYIGETSRSNKRWQGQHDCKKYVENYHSLHYQHGIKPAINIAFYWEVPVQTKARKQLELSLILKWRSPFNRENWSLWGKPFG